MWNRWLRQRLFFGILFLLILPAISLWADGGYFPPKAYPTMPAIPAQQAIIRYRDGIETLVVESAFKTDAPEVAWILPLPAPPTSLSEGDPGMVTAALFSLRPSIVHDLGAGQGIPSTLCLVMIPLMLVSILTRDKAARWRRGAGWVVLTLMLLFLWAIFLPSLGSAGGLAASETSGVSILSAQRLTNADFLVIQADDAQALNGWLSQELMRPMDANAQAIVNDYIARKWCFVVGMYRPEKNDMQVPRPLIATFPASSPVFPMKLTAVAGTTTHVEIAVIAQQRAEAKGFSCVASDAFSFNEGYSYEKRSESPSYHGLETALCVGSPEVVPMMWNNCVATHLVADLPPSEMKADVAIQMAPNLTIRQTKFSERGARQMAGVLLYSGLTLCMMVAAVIWRGRRSAGPARRMVLLVLLAVTCAATLGAVMLTPTVPVQMASGGRHWSANRHGMLHDVLDLVRKTPEMISGALSPETLDHFPQTLVDHHFAFPEELQNDFTGKAMRREHSPGNFDVRQIKGHWCFCLYDADTVETYVALDTVAEP